MSQPCRLLVACFLLILPVVAQAQDEAPKSVALTVYSAPSPDPYGGGYYGGYYDYYGNWVTTPQGYAVVKEVRSIELKQGRNELRYSNVPQQIDATTVHFKSLLDPKGSYVLEQDFEYDLVSADKLLSRYIGEDVTLFLEDGQKSSGRLMSYDGMQLVLSTNDAEAPIQIVSRGEFIERIAFAELPGGLILKPTLVWDVEAKQAGVHDCEVTYQTNGISWSADYNLILNSNDTAADLSAWVTLSNNSGGSYQNAQLKLVAGDVQRAPMATPYGAYDSRSSMPSSGSSAGFSEQAFFEYHMYTLGRETTLSNNSTKQLELFNPVTAVPAKKSYTFQGNNSYVYDWVNYDAYYGTPNSKVDVTIELDNSERAGLGIPLPAGRVRVFKADPKDASIEFVGEDRIDHTAKDEKLRVKTGSAFDIVGEWKVADFQVDYSAQWMEESIEVVLRNHKTEAVTVRVPELMYRWSNWEITKKTQDFVKTDSRRVQFELAVPADGESKLSYTVRYTW
ncbi:MAG: DUF4139 domain-containing protein [Myxococcota bacterium]|jgi:hypothetical protein|nr:DUF4139 domain-containing protein [Myxococcota bacterium]